MRKKAWKEKQNFLHGDTSKPLPEQITWSSAFLISFQEASTLERITAGKVERRFETRWKPPEANCLKLNVDASFNTNLNKFSVGGVVRDNQGRLLLVFGKHINQPLSMVHGELLAIREGVNLLYEKNFRDVQVATDSLLAVQAVTANQENLGYEGLCAKDIRRRFQKPTVSDFSHVSRSANRISP
ncbi:uncharacterized protein [Primulina eburnea]|uniref:uncharacterized protein n=1 Tax=Primulina eburnea TaxID=1245227 RepID=UPI003C6C0C56